jgi:hypothetical protein
MHTHQKLSDKRQQTRRHVWGSTPNPALLSERFKEVLQMKVLVSLLVMFCICPGLLFAQQTNGADVVVKKDGTILPGRILSVTEHKVVIDPEGPLSYQSISSNQISQIDFVNGGTLDFPINKGHQYALQTIAYSPGTSTYRAHIDQALSRKNSLRPELEVGFGLCFVSPDDINELTEAMLEGAGLMADNPDVNLGFGFSGKLTYPLHKNIKVGAGINYQEAFKFFSYNGRDIFDVSVSSFSPYVCGILLCPISKQKDEQVNLKFESGLGWYMGKAEWDFENGKSIILRGEKTIGYHAGVGINIVSSTQRGSKLSITADLIYRIVALPINEFKIGEHIIRSNGSGLTIDLGGLTLKGAFAIEF